MRINTRAYRPFLFTRSWTCSTASAFRNYATATPGADLSQSFDRIGDDQMSNLSANQSNRRQRNTWLSLAIMSGLGAGAYYWYVNRKEYGKRSDMSDVQKM